MKMTLDAPTIASTKSNLGLLIDVEMLLGLNVSMPLLHALHSLIKFDMFVCNFIALVKICEGDIYWMYRDIHSSFQGDVFMNFQALINCVHESINFHWITYLNIGPNHLAFEFVGQHIWATFVD
jgi:hypothetical protein